MALWSTQPLVKMSNRNISWGWRRLVREADNLTTFMCPMSWKSGSLNLLEPSGPHQACYGTPLPLPVYIPYLPEYKMIIFSSFAVWEVGGLPYNDTQSCSLSVCVFSWRFKIVKEVSLCAGSLYVQVNVIVKAVGSLRVLYQVMLFNVKWYKRIVTFSELERIIMELPTAYFTVLSQTCLNWMRAAIRNLSYNTVSCRVMD